jgi:L-fuculose-phosphate aldolase
VIPSASTPPIRPPGQPDDPALRQAVIDTCLAMNARGLNQGKAGNVSVRVAGGCLITPTGVPYAALTPADIVFLDTKGRPHGSLLPSSEWHFHHAIYAARADAGAVVHTHALFCTTLACAGRAIPAFHYMVAVAGGPDIRCAPYATFGTPELAAHAVAALEGRTACLLANHGMIALGASPAKALDLAAEVETLAAMYWHVLQLGQPVLLDAAEMDVVLEKFRTYGVQAPTGA